MRILVADQDQINQKVLVNMLAYQGHSASDLVGDHEALLARLQENSVDLVLIDWALVSSEDFHLVRTMHSQDLMSRHCLLVMVPGMDQQLIDQATRHGLRDFIPKPIPTHMLESKITQLGKRPGKGGGPSLSNGRSGGPGAGGNGMGENNDRGDADSEARKYYLEGKKLLTAGRTKQAINVLARALGAKECFPEALRAVGVAFSRLRDTRRGRHFLDKAAEAFVQARRFDEAARFYRELKSKGFGPRNPFKRCADALRSANDLQGAIALYGRALDLEPGDTMAAMHMVKCCGRTGDKDQAIPVLISLLEATGGPDWARAEYKKLTGSPWSSGLNVDAGARDASMTRTEAVAASPGPETRILIVDDEPHIRLLLEQTLECLEDEGVRLSFAENGEQGLAAIREQAPDLVFLDVMMPKMNGFDVCAAVKKEPAFKDVYVVMLTAKGQEFDRKKGLAAGADVYMTKPFRPKDVERLARSVLDLC